LEGGVKEDLVSTLKKLSRVFSELGIHYVLVGGLACVLYGVERATLDIDLIVERVEEGKARELAARLSEEGLYIPVGEVLGALREGGHATILLGGMRRVDLKFSSTPLDVASLKNFVEVHLGCASIKVAGLEECVAAKIAVLGDLKDLEDALILMDIHRDRIDWGKLNKYLGGNPLQKIAKLLDRVEAVYSGEEAVIRKVRYLRQYVKSLSR